MRAVDHVQTMGSFIAHYIEKYKCFIPRDTFHISNDMMGNSYQRPLVRLIVSNTRKINLILAEFKI